jgi:hypothetical protein
MDKNIEHDPRVITNNAIRERLNSSNLTMGDLIAAKAYGISAECDPNIFDDLNAAINVLKEN